MNIRSESGNHMISFDNLVFAPHEEDPPSSWENAYDGSLRDSNDSSDASEGRVIFTLGPCSSASYSERMVDADSPESQSSTTRLIDSIRDRAYDYPSMETDSNERENSQGYHFFYSTYFSRRRFFSCIRNRFTSLLCGPPTVPSFCTTPYLDIEVPRSDPAGGDLIDLSEFFPRVDTFEPLEREGTPPPPQPVQTAVVNKVPPLQGETMGSLLRSEQMELVELIIPKEIAYECVAEIGRVGVVQFNDLNQSKSLFQRYFIRDTRRCEEIVRKLRFLRKEIAECDPPIQMEPASTSGTEVSIPSLTEVSQLDARLDELEKDLTLLNQNYTRLRKNLNEMREFKAVLEKVETFFEIHVEEEALNEIEAAEEALEVRKCGRFDVVRVQRDSTFQKSFNSASKFAGNAMPLTPLLAESEKGENAWFIAGVIPVDKRRAFERVLWRACRRTAFVRISDDRTTFEDPETNDTVDKCVFIVFFKGQSLKMIVDKVCDGFNARQYPCPKTSHERQTALFDVASRIHDHSIIIDSSKRHRFESLSAIAQDLPFWCQKVHIHKSIYCTLNMCTVDTNGFLQAECWVPVTEKEHVQKALQEGYKGTGSEVAPVLNALQTTATPPTFNRTNKFTNVFQSIVDSYGIASYREVNPAPFTIISFPFLFAVMFGDAAHGLILFLAGLFFIRKEKIIMEKRIKDEIFNTFFGGRYIIILMGLFSIYTGLIYNDAFAKSFNVFDSRWKNPFNHSDLYPVDGKMKMNPDALIMLDPMDALLKEDGPYPFGVDPIWNIAENRLSFINSMKMKISVILGVAQMTFGVLLSLLNHRYFKSSIDTWTNFVPQIIFLSCIFIYLCVQIVVKWVFFTAEPNVIFGQEYPGSFCAPSLLIGLINTFMFKPRDTGFVLEDGTQDPTCHLNQWYPNQAQVEAVLIGVSLACVPIMLLGKPIATWLSLRKKNSAKKAEESTLLENGGRSTAGDKDHGSLGDVIVHQAIHTIEFVLGCVSHTASYLRLWALSLAHAQLSEVLWHMVLIRGMSLFDGFHPIFNALAAFIIFFIFAILTFSILVMMEGLSAFLHALRLHWVEFQSKFYQGVGHAFHPYSLRDAIEAADQQIEAVDDSL